MTLGPDPFWKELIDCIPEVRFTLYNTYIFSFQVLKKNNKMPHKKKLYTYIIHEHTQLKKDMSICEQETEFRDNVNTLYT